MVIETARNAGKNVVVADTRYTRRWNDRGLDPVQQKGDLALAVNNKTMQDRLESWTTENDNGNPRSVDDLCEEEFADVLKDASEEAHLDAAVSYAFAGTEEILAEYNESSNAAQTNAHRIPR